MKNISIIFICLIVFCSCASQDYGLYLNAKLAMANAPQRVIAEMNGVKVYDQHPTELSAPQQGWWIPLITSAIAMTGQVILGVSGNNAQVDIVRALASGIGSTYSSYSANVSNTTSNTGSGNSAGRDLITGTKTDTKSYSDSSTTGSFNPALSFSADQTYTDALNDKSQHPATTTTTTSTTTTSTTNTDNSKTNTDNPVTNPVVLPPTQAN